VNKEYYSIENQIKRNEIRNQLDTDKKIFKKLSKEGKLNYEVKWHLSKNNIELKYLGDDCHKSLNTKKDYSIYMIDKTELFRVLDPSFKRVYKKENLWKKHCEDKITKVLQNWKKGYCLIPPVLILNLPEKCLLIQDGKHRFAVANYFETEQIPLIILNVIEKRFLELVNSAHIKKID